MLIITILIYKIHLTTICVFILGRGVLMKDGGGKSSERSIYFGKQGAWFHCITLFGSGLAM